MPQASLLSYFPKPVASSVEDRHHPSIKQPQTTKDMNVTEPECSTVKSNTSAIIRKLQENRDLSRTVTDSETTGARDNGRKHADTASGPEPEARKVITDFGLTAQCSEVFSVPHLPEAIIAPVQKAHLPAIQRLTSTTLPISRVVLYSSDPVGWIRCRLEPCSPRTDASLSGPELSQIYIQALALLSPYRSLGLASILLETILSSSIARASATVCIYAHVWEKNEDALDWYAKRGFKRVLLVEQYYRRLKPSGAWIVRKELDGS
ncbi:hypothetical protein LTR13_004988 [Exophiala sideris]|nr:hypothetical protein LTR13_004988 [Exophiala sideris]KAK5182341.1 hypothetical protein LTR44_005352 [Eurotiomycetes sp. CCFEE 6388]